MGRQSVTPLEPRRLACLSSFKRLKECTYVRLTKTRRRLISLHRHLTFSRAVDLVAKLHASTLPRFPL